MSEDGLVELVSLESESAVGGNRPGLAGSSALRAVGYNIAGDGRVVIGASAAATNGGTPRAIFNSAGEVAYYANVYDSFSRESPQTAARVSTSSWPSP